jgi:hypothetical protein
MAEGDCAENDKRGFADLCARDDGSAQCKVPLALYRDGTVGCFRLSASYYDPVGDQALQIRHRTYEHAELPETAVPRCGSGMARGGPACDGFNGVMRENSANKWYCAKLCTITVLG